MVCSWPGRVVSGRSGYRGSRSKIDSLFERDWIAGFAGAKTTYAGRVGKARRADSIAATVEWHPGRRRRASPHYRRTDAEAVSGCVLWST
jgi:hypothetical protein